MTDVPRRDVAEIAQRKLAEIGFTEGDDVQTKLREVAFTDGENPELQGLVILALRQLMRGTRAAVATTASYAERDNPIRQGRAGEVDPSELAPDDHAHREVDPRS